MQDTRLKEGEELNIEGMWKGEGIEGMWRREGKKSTPSQM